MLLEGSRLRTGLRVFESVRLLTSELEVVVVVRWDATNVDETELTGGL